MVGISLVKIYLEKTVVGATDANGDLIMTEATLTRNCHFSFEIKITMMPYTYPLNVAMPPVVCRRIYAITRIMWRMGHMVWDSIG